MRKMIAVSAVAAGAAIFSPSFGATAVWKSNAGGNMSDPANWVDGYVPQAGDTLNFEAMTSEQVIRIDISDGRRFLTMTNFSYTVFRADDANSGNHLNFEKLECGNAVKSYLGSGAYLDISGKVIYSGLFILPRNFAAFISRLAVARRKQKLFQISCFQSSKGSTVNCVSWQCCVLAVRAAAFNRIIHSTQSLECNDP